MPDDSPRCLQCQRSSNEVPLIRLAYQGEEHWICPQHLPILIHKPGQLAEQLPGAEKFAQGENHAHH